MKKAILILCLALIGAAAFAQSTTIKKPKKVKTETAPAQNAPVVHLVTISLPDDQMRILLGGSAYGANDFLMNSDISAQNVKPTVEFFWKNTLQEALRQFNVSLKAEQDSIASVKARADSIAKAAVKPKS